MRLQASFKDIWILAYPIIVGSLAQNLIGLTDVVFLGRVGPVELGASGLISVYYLVLVMIGFGISRSGQILIARRAGQGKAAEIGSITYNLLYLEEMVAGLIFIFLFTLSPFVLALFINSDAIYYASLDYLKYRSFGIFFSFFGFVVMSLYTGIGRTKIIVVIMTVLFLSNVCLNYVLIFGMYGFPKMGIAGAGLGSSIAEVLAALVGVILMAFDKDLKKYKIFQLHAIKRGVMRRLASLSTPMVLQYVIGLGGWFLLFSLIENMGEDALSVSTVVKSVYTFYSIPSWGFASAANALVSNIIGQRKYKQVFIAINRTAILSLVFTVVLCLSLILFSVPIFSIFTNDIDVIQGCYDLVYMLIAMTLACSVSVIVFNGLMGTGAMLFSLFAETLAVILYLFYAFVVVKGLGLSLTFVWMSEFMYWVALMLIARWYLNTRRWMKLKI